GGPDDVVAVACVEDETVLVLRLDEPPPHMVGRALVPAHLLDVDGVPEAVDRLLLLVGLRETHLARHAQIVAGGPLPCRPVGPRDACGMVIRERLTRGRTPR